MALAIQTAHCVIQNQKLVDSQFTDNAFSLSQILEEADIKKSSANDLCELIRKYKSELKHTGISGCLCVLLPKITGQSILKDIIYELVFRIGRDTSLDIYLYPYGEPSFLMALARIQRETKVGRPTWVLSLNTREHDDINSHESFILAACTEKSSGLTLDTISIDLDAVKPDIAVEKVIKQLGVSCQSPISDLTFTIAGEEPLWLHSISGLSPWVTVSTQYHFPNLKFGSLGACNGLLKALTLFQQQILQPNSSFQALQLDIEPNGYVAGTLFGWSND